jgi:transposase-like protein
MVRKAYTPEQIINKLKEAEVLLSQGATIGEVSRKIGVTEQTYYRWRKEYGGLRIEQAVVSVTVISGRLSRSRH